MALLHRDADGHSRTEKNKTAYVLLYVQYVQGCAASGCRFGGSILLDTAASNRYMWGIVEICGDSPSLGNKARWLKIFEDVGLEHTHPECLACPPRSPDFTRALLSSLPPIWLPSRPSDLAVCVCVCLWLVDGRAAARLAGLEVERCEEAARDALQSPAKKHQGDKGSASPAGVSVARR